MGTWMGNPSSFMFLKKKKKKENVYCLKKWECLKKKNPAFHTKKIDLEYKDANNKNKTSILSGAVSWYPDIRSDL